MDGKMVCFIESSFCDIAKLTRDTVACFLAWVRKLWESNRLHLLSLTNLASGGFIGLFGLTTVTHLHLIPWSPSMECEG